MANKTIKRVSVGNLKSFGPTKAVLQAKEVGEFSVMLHGKMSWSRFSCPPTWLPQYKCMKIFKTLNSCNFYVHWCMDLKLAEIFQNGVI